MSQPPRAPLEPLNLPKDETLVFAAPEIDRSRRPLVTLGRSAKTGELYVHLRVYRRNGEEAVSKYHMTDAGCSLSPEDFREAFARFEALMSESSI